MWLLIVSLVRFLRSFFDGHASYKLTQLGADVGNTMALGMVKKSLKYSVLCNKKFKMGELANLLQVDCFRLGQFPKNLSSVVNIVYVLIFSVCFMGFLVQASFLAGFGVILMQVQLICLSPEKMLSTKKILLLEQMKEWSQLTKFSTISNSSKSMLGKNIFMTNSKDWEHPKLEAIRRNFWYKPSQHSLCGWHQKWF